MDWKKILLGGGLAAAAPFTGGSSLTWLPAALGTAGVGTALGGVFSGSKGKDSMGDIDSILAQLKSGGDSLKATGDALTAQGSQTLTPILNYFKKLAGGDEGVTAAATRPQRRRVIDQYDTARQMIGEFSPRGGGSNAALAGSRFNEASDISDIEANARTAATTEGAQIGTTLEGLGLSAQQLRSADLNTIINALLTKRGQTAQAATGMAEGLGTLLGLILTRNKGGADGGGGTVGGPASSAIFNAGIMGI